ncbi:MAG TPA: MFS transporter, partial [Dehalococcoidia bacterium]|nr:MFS transporter [Dehalococcoidia bacterium]
MGGVLLAAADTYVIVLALPALMASLGIGLDELQRATPIVSGFLLGYVAVMPLIGRLSDMFGRRPLLLICLSVFAAGSLVTASASTLGEAVAGRALQGLGGGGLVPLTLALVADWWSPAERGLPLGVAGGVQEFGSVAGPLYGALILSVSGWRTIFWLNLPLCALLVALLAAVWRAPGRRRLHRLPVLLVGIAAAAAALAVAAPGPLVADATWGALFVPLLGVGWLSPLAVVAVAAAAAALAMALRGVSLGSARRAMR